MLKLFYRPLIKLSAILCFITASTFTLAAPFTVTYLDTVRPGDPAPYIPGEEFNINIVLDNGGTSTANQTWTSADIVSITFSINNAPNTITTTFSPVVLSSSSGSFTTDASGILTAVPTDWSDSASGNDSPVASTVSSTNDANTLNAFYINAGNAVYYTSGPDAGMTNIANNTTPAFWTISSITTPTSVPTLSQWSLILLSLILVGYGLFSTRRTY